MYGFFLPRLILRSVSNRTSSGDDDSIGLCSDPALHVLHGYDVGTTRKHQCTFAKHQRATQCVVGLVGGLNL